ncbi:pentapeptide repeat-containing protein [Actinomadura harenae]|uniref:Pentapeptide repeat-containing protein n=1 Tax=Actinomadura harenae TaxID=2483351 RepID=A0A3M2M7C9_9ACTN|nr:pentapeptide repeat-containing protein [Actinomadura harenae]RMI45471.1 pentapeptide repeat-containing protein [Actinomadura harenae]
MGQMAAKQELAGLGTSSEVVRQVFDSQDLISLQTRQLWFVRCSFVGADLRQATLDRCSFKLCDLRGANLRGASLRGTHLAGCDLRDADLRDVDLTDAQFGWVNTGRPPWGLTDLTGADLAGATTTRLCVDRVVGWPPPTIGTPTRGRR